MKLEELFLKKEELPILYKTCFQIPIHKKLLDPSLNIDTSIAQRIFPEVAEDWYEDLKKYTPEDKQEKEWIDNVFLKEKLVIEKQFNHQIMNFWRDDVYFMDNGLVDCFSINRNAGGSIYFNEDDSNCRSIGKAYIHFFDEKYQEFKPEDENNLFVYSSHNIDHYPGALFLRNWAIKYMNEVFKEVFK
jgi:hypothetical protein